MTDTPPPRPIPTDIAVIRWDLVAEGARLVAEIVARAGKKESANE